MVAQPPNGEHRTPEEILLAQAKSKLEVQQLALAAITIRLRYAELNEKQISMLRLGALRFGFDRQLDNLLKAIDEDR